MSFNIVGHKCSENVLVNDQYQIKRDLLTKIFKKKTDFYCPEWSVYSYFRR